MSEIIWQPNEGQQTESLRRTEREILYGGARGGGKRICLTTPVLTKEGWKKAGDITKNDFLVSPDGSYTKIKGIFSKEKGTMYRITFIDGRYVDCDGEHLWKVNSKNHGHRDGWLVRSTNQLIKNPSGWSVPLVERTPGKKWKGADPYILGYILGDGSLTGKYTTIYTVDDETIEYLKMHGWKIYNYRSQNTTMCQYMEEDFRKILGRVSGKKKHIPKKLLESDNDTRLELLRGLMDSDGHCGKDGKASFTNKSLTLCEDIVYLTRSLGGKAVIHEIHRGERHVRGYKSDGFYYKVTISYVGKFNPFRLSRKSNRVHMGQIEDKLGIKSIERIEDKPAVCFAVDHASHLFVIKDFIVTHNTDAGMAWLLRWIDNPRYRALIIRINEKDLRDWVERAKVMYAGTGAKFAYRPTEIRFPSGAMFVTGHLNDSNAYTQYQGHEYQKILIEELTQIPSEELYMKIKASNRSTVDGLHPQIFATTNPGEVGHIWVKNRFIDVAKPGEPYFEKDQETGLTLSRIFIPAKVEDNPVLMKKDPEYVAQLNSLPDDLRRAWRDGSWDVFETKGAFYSKHISKAREEGRICALPYDKNLPLHSTWDLGVGKNMATWCFQVWGKEIRWIDYIEAEEGEDILYTLNIMDQKYENFGTFYFPHDIDTKHANSKNSAFDVAINWGVEDYQKGNREDPMHRIRATQMLFDRFWFNSDNARVLYGINLLNQYRKKMDEKNQVYTGINKDFTNHCADALGTYPQMQEDPYMKQGYKTPKPQVYDPYSV